MESCWQDGRPLPELGWYANHQLPQEDYDRLKWDASRQNLTGQDHMAGARDIFQNLHKSLHFVNLILRKRIQIWTKRNFLVWKKESSNSKFLDIFLPIFRCLDGRRRNKSVICVGNIDSIGPILAIDRRVSDQYLPIPWAGRRTHVEQSIDSFQSPDPTRPKELPRMLCLVCRTQSLGLSGVGDTCRDTSHTDNPPSYPAMCGS